MIDMHNRIGQLRRQLDMTQEELAARVGVSRQTIIALEGERYNPSLRLAYAITRALQARHIEELFIFKK